jgi:GNAT superfamily N-acetyltransferase
VLRPHESEADQALPDDDAPGTVTFAALVGDEVVGSVRVAWSPVPAVLAGAVPSGADEEGWQLRAMATREDVRRQGIGASLVDRVVDHVAAHGGGVLWCNARLGAVALYRRAGFLEAGEVFELPAIGPHVVMGRRVAPGA